MNRSTAAQRAARLFWRVVGGSLLVVSGVVLAWLLGNRNTPPMTMLDACLMMMRQFWGLTLQQVTAPAIAAGLVLGLVGSGAWAGGRSLLAWWRTRRLLAHSVSYCPGRWSTLDAALATLPPGPWRLRTLSTTHPVACTVGLWRPQIVLSADLVAALTPAELGAVIGHEWGHVCRRDPLRLALLQFCSTALWFLPIIRAFTHDSTRAMEDAADDSAVALTQAPLELAAALVKTAKAQARLHWSPVPALGGEQVVTERVERLLALAPARPPQQHARTWAVSTVIAACLLGFLIVPQQPVVAAMPVLPFGPQPSMMACPMGTQQR